MLQRRPNTFAQTILSLSFFACDKAADHTFRRSSDLVVIGGTRQMEPDTFPLEFPSRIVLDRLGNQQYVLGTCFTFQAVISRSAERQEPLHSSPRPTTARTSQPCSPGPRTTLTKEWFSPKRKPFSVEASPSSAQPRTRLSLRAIPGSSFAW